MATNDEYADIFHNLLNKDELIEKFGWEEYFVFALMLGVSIFLMLAPQGPQRGEHCLFLYIGDH